MELHAECMLAAQSARRGMTFIVLTKKAYVPAGADHKENV